MELAKAKTIAEEAVRLLKPHCERIEIVGSIRRKRPFVNDIDLLLIPNNQGQLAGALLETWGNPKLKGSKLIRIQLPEITLDIYIATAETWATLLLIRTGSASHNIDLAMLAKRRGLKLHADGTGLTREGVRIGGDTEESIFEALTLSYRLPEER